MRSVLLSAKGICLAIRPPRPTAIQSLYENAAACALYLHAAPQSKTFFLIRFHLTIGRVRLIAGVPTIPIPLQS
jgi:hypothetical protein